MVKVLYTNLTRNQVDHIIGNSLPELNVDVASTPGQEVIKLFSC